MRPYSPARPEVSICFPTVVTKLEPWVPYLTRTRKFSLSQLPEMEGGTAKQRHQVLLYKAQAIVC